MTELRADGVRVAMASDPFHAYGDRDPLDRDGRIASGAG